MKVGRCVVGMNVLEDGCGTTNVSNATGLYGTNRGRSVAAGGLSRTQRFWLLTLVLPQQKCFNPNTL